jgi:exoribonuclease R
MTPAIRAPVAAPPLAEAFGRIRAEFNIAGSFPAAVDAEAAAVAHRGPVVPPSAMDGERRDARDVPFVTIDPPGSRDLDQAYHAERRPGGYRVHYAIADVAAFVAPGGEIDAEAFARGVTLYLPDARAPLMPDVVGEGCASLLAGQERPALLWTIDLDETGRSAGARLERATVRSRMAMSYAKVQVALDAGRAGEPLELLRTIGSLRSQLQAERGGMSLDLPTQEVVATAGGGFTLRYEAPLPVEGWNAQISLLAGMEAAAIMVQAGTGILRTVPAPDRTELDRLRRTAGALGVAWPEGARWSDVVVGLDRTKPEDAAFLIQAAHGLRGAGYVKLDAATTGGGAIPVHAGVAAPYAHVTAPLRRLADRHANEIVLAHSAGAEPPAWATQALDRLVPTMEAATRRDAGVERAVVDAVECAVLSSRIGDRFDAVVIDTNRHGVIVQLSGVAIVAALPADVPLGERVSVLVTGVDPLARQVRLAPADATVSDRRQS